MAALFLKTKRFKLTSVHEVFFSSVSKKKNLTLLIHRYNKDLKPIQKLFALFDIFDRLLHCFGIDNVEPVISG